MSMTLTQIDALALTAEGPLLQSLIEAADLSPLDRKRIVKRAATLVRRIRANVRPGLMEIFLVEYGLSTDEGIALMCLAEALLRVPDADTMDELIEDKIAPSDWGKHLGKSASSLVNASTWALMLTGKVLEDREPGVMGHLRGAVKRLGEPVIRTAVARAMKEMGRQFVLGETIKKAMKRAAEQEAVGYSYSYDMLGEAARTMGDAKRYVASYEDAIAHIASACTTGDIRSNPGISVKLSALHPRYEVAQEGRVMAELAPVVLSLCQQAKAADMGLNIDAEEADRLTLSLQVIEAVLSDESLAGWDGFGVVVQAYGRRANVVLDWLHALATRLDRKIMVRLVKGAYWDSEVKRAQVLGLEDFPVFTRKDATDVSYIANARKLLGMTDRIYPQFATHNAHTVAAILDMADDQPFEFQRLHGMGERLHDIVLKDERTRSRIYAPVGAHRDLLAYLVRRLLENGANSSFVHKIVDDEVAPEDVVACPFVALEPFMPDPSNKVLTRGPDLFMPERVNSAGSDLTARGTLAAIEAARAHAPKERAEPLLAGPVQGHPPKPVLNPATDAVVGDVIEATEADVATAIAAAAPWTAPAQQRADILTRAADLYEAELGPICALLATEAGKTLSDAIGELREAVDFLRYYAAQAIGQTAAPLGVVTCISPWNFPLAIFTGQIVAALAAGNAVLAKPAGQTPLIATFATRLLLKAGIPAQALQLLPGDGVTVGRALTSDPRIDGVVFTGSTGTAQAIRRAMADHMAPGAVFIAETGGINAMIVDSTALPEQVVRDVVASSFQSAGQRCSALRCLYLQDDIADTVLEMIYGAMDELTLGDPWHLTTDVGPVIDDVALKGIMDHIEAAKAEGRVLKSLPVPSQGNFAPPTVIRVKGMADLTREIFGPVLHVATYRARDLKKVMAAINASGYGLTFGLHSRIDNRVQEVTEALHVGNIYVNRNQIGAVVGSQPFGGEALSGTGPKAGGPHYVARLTVRPAPEITAHTPAPLEDEAALQAALIAAKPGPASLLSTVMPGPTGESNRLTLHSRIPVLCLGPGDDAANAQAEMVRKMGGTAVTAPGTLPSGTLTRLQRFSGAIWWGDADTARALAQSLAARKGSILPLITGTPDEAHVTLERHICVDTTAAGGNAALLAEAGST